MSENSLQPGDLVMSSCGASRCQTLIFTKNDVIRNVKVDNDRYTDSVAVVVSVIEKNYCAVGAENVDSIYTIEPESLGWGYVTDEYHVLLERPL